MLYWHEYMDIIPCLGVIRRFRNVRNLPHNWRLSPGRRKEAVQSAGMVGLFQAPGAAESDASVRLKVRSHVPGTRRDRAQADETGSKKAKP